LTTGNNLFPNVTVKEFTKEKIARFVKYSRLTRIFSLHTC